MLAYNVPGVDNLKLTRDNYVDIFLGNITNWNDPKIAESNPGDESYPIVTYTWILLYKKYDDPNKAIAMEAMVQFALNEGEKQSPNLGYIPLPMNVRERVAAVTNEITPDFELK